MSKIIMGIKVQERVESAKKVQDLLTKYGCDITTRLGVHMASSDACSPQGLIILEFVEGIEDSVAEFEKELSKLEKIEVQKMVFS